MKPRDFRDWRKTLKLSQKEAADALGLKRRVVQYYEKGERNGEEVKIPRTVQLACWAVWKGHTGNWDGPSLAEHGSEGNKKRKKKKDGKKRDKERDLQIAMAANGAEMAVAAEEPVRKSKVKHKDKSGKKTRAPEEAVLDGARRRKARQGSGQLKRRKGQGGGKAAAE
ncbi:MAG: helix-turn-helix transcriptional regulator [Alphaproteobacteria bacterium]|nr:helix-turn-helix transcriptional regulator [Alphaproteobacteria bacterium]